MIIKKKYRKTFVELIIKFLCILIAIELILVNFGFCGHSHHQWNELHQTQFEITETTEDSFNNVLHVGNENSQPSEKDHDSNCHFQCPCHGGITGVLNIFGWQIISPQNCFFMHENQDYNFLLIRYVYHPPLLNN